MSESDREADVDTNINITPEMIEAGEEEFTSYDSRVDDLKDVVRAIFLVMYRIRKRAKVETALTCE